MLSRCRGLLRRVWRRRITWELNRLITPHAEGRNRLWGYGFSMSYPDKLIWLNQMREIFCEDCYGVHRLPRKARVIDGGANVGAFTLRVLWARPEAHVVAVEPSPENLHYLRQNLACRLAVGRVDVVPKALTAEYGKVHMIGQWSDAQRIHASEGVIVDAVPLGRFLERDVDLVKLDIEGAEMEVLAACGEALRRVARLVVEYHLYGGDESRLPELLAIIRDAGFGRFRVFDVREFSRTEAGTPSMCCLVEAWRVS